MSDKTYSGLIAVLGLVSMVIFCFGIPGLLVESSTEPAPRSEQGEHFAGREDGTDPPSGMSAASDRTRSGSLQAGPVQADLGSLASRDADEGGAVLPNAKEPAESPPPNSPFDTIGSINYEIAIDSTSRTWTARNGKFTAEGKMTGYADGSVALKLVSGNTAIVPLVQLSNEDVRYVAEFMRVESGSQVILGQVSKDAIDAETFTFVDVLGGKHQVRLAGVILPTGLTDGDALSIYRSYLDTILGLNGWIEVHGRGDDDRLLVTLYAEGINKNLELLSKGIGWYNAANHVDPRFANAEFVARLEQVGVWNSALEKPSP